MDIKDSHSWDKARPKPLRFRFSGTPQMCRLRWASVLCFPRLSSSGNQELEELTLPRFRAPYPLPIPACFWASQVQCTLCLFLGADLWLQPSRLMSTIQNLMKSLVRNWKPVCSLVGNALSGAEFSSFQPGGLPRPCLLWEMGQSTAG